jgi:hypothetical protein
MNRRLSVIILILLFIAAAAFAGERKLRFAATGGIVLQNDFLGQFLLKGAAGVGGDATDGNVSTAGAGTGGAGLALAYPVSEKSRLMNIELAIANWYNIYPYRGNRTHTFRVGFGIRVFLNLLDSIRPYFTHDICSHLVWVSDRTDYASAYGVLLGLGIDIPLDLSGGGGSGDTGNLEKTGGGETSSIFFDLSYNTFRLAQFSPEPEEVKFFAASFGFSWLVGGRNR